MQLKFWPDPLLLIAIALFVHPALEAQVAVSPDDAVRWQPVTLTFEGPQTSEGASPNPFLDYRMSVSFLHQQSGESRTAQGFFAADGNAAETSVRRATGGASASRPRSPALGSGGLSSARGPASRSARPREPRRRSTASPALCRWARPPQVRRDSPPRDS